MVRRRTLVAAFLRRRALWLVATTGIVVSSLVPFGAVAGDPSQTWERAESVFHYHNPQAFRPCPVEVTTSGGPAIDCAGLIDSFDGLSLSVTLRIPKDSTEPLPTLVYLHSFAGNRGDPAFNEGFGTFGSSFSKSYFTSKGYAVVIPAARGMGGSCGHRPNTGPHDVEGFPQVETPHGPPPPGFPSNQHDFTCSRGWSHLNERDYETVDIQHLLSTLVDAGVSDPDRLAVAGYSYGAVQAWMLATSLPWMTPKGTRLQIAAAVPIAGGTSAQNSLVPNGRATDDRDARSLERPYGIPKLSSLATLGAVGRAFPGGPMRWNDTDPSETHSYSTAWLEFWAKGEPFDTAFGKMLAEVFRNKGAYHAGEYFASLRTQKAKPVPILAVQGWNDATFPAVEALQMYRKLKAADPNYPISVFLTDIGHSNGRDKGEFCTLGHGLNNSLNFCTTQIRDAWVEAANDFLDAYALRGGEGAPAERIVSMSTECSPRLGAPPAPPETVVASDWDSIHPRTLVLRGNGRLSTESDPPNLREESITDPGTPKEEFPATGGCIRQPLGTYSNQGDYSWDVPSSGITLLGLPQFVADYKLSGVDATVIAKLWDVDPGGQRTLVTRALYRLAIAGGDTPEGKLKFKLFGNHYRFTADHRIELEISQTDVPFLQPDRLQSSITFSNVRLDLPLTTK